jgi:serum/glucocorticoid-regulated kinase 2
MIFLPNLDSMLTLMQIHEHVPPNTTLPVCPLSVDTTTSDAPPTKRKSSFLTTLSRLASPPSRVTPLPPLTPTQGTPEDEGDKPLAAPAVAAYLNTFANEQHVRVTRPWKRFVRVRTEDLQSTRVERAIKRVRSDIAKHTSTAGITNMAAPPPPPPSTGPSSIMNVEAVPPPALPLHEEEGEPLVSQEVLDAIETGTEPEDKTQPAPAQPQPQLHPHPHPQRQLQVEASTAAQAVSLTPVHADSKPVRVEVLEPVAPEHEAEEEPQPDKEAQPEKEKEKEHPAARIPRSLSADPDKAARLSRMFSRPSEHDTMPKSGMETETETETEGEGEGEGTDVQTDANAQSDATNGPAERDKAMKKKKKKKVPHARKSSRKVVVDDFEMMRVLGKGCAGKVLLVRHKASNELYALKAITKKHVLAHQELQHTLTEQAVLKRMAHEGTDPFVVRLWWSFHDRENLFLVMVRFPSFFYLSACVCEADG